MKIKESSLIVLTVVFFAIILINFCGAYWLINDYPQIFYGMVIGIVDYLIVAALFDVLNQSI